MRLQIWVTLLLLMSGHILFGQDKTPITSVDQLPRRTFTLKTTNLEELLADKAALTEIANTIQTNIVDDLATYDIQDKSTLKGYYDRLAAIAMFKGELALAGKYLELGRPLIEKEAEELLHGQDFDAIKRAKESVGSMSGEEFEAAYEQNLYENLSTIPFDLIRDNIESRKGGMALFSRNTLMGSVQGQLQPMVDNMGAEVPEGIALSLVSIRYAMDKALPLKDESVRVYERLLSENPAEEAPKQNIWAAREVNLTQTKDLSTVVIGIWDSGVDMEVLAAENRYTNPKEKIDGLDNDKNGFVDDMHGIAYDKDNYKVSEILSLPEGLTYPVSQLQGFTKGSLDLQANIDSEEAQALKTFVSEMAPSKMRTFMEDLGWYGLHAHGTHVAGIAQAGNPKAQILAARFSYSTNTIPDLPTMEGAKRRAKSYKEIVAYFKAHNVRVVNMSWRYNAASYEGGLAAHNVGDSPEERKEMAQKLFKVERDALYKAIKDAPEILFVCGSGNENNDADFSEYIPASFNLPNLITIGAVDIEGKKTSFTSEGKSIDFYANGFEVESYVPGGDRLNFSGTSMASPQVANLAGKMFAIYPELEIVDVLDIMQSGSEISDEGVRLINPKKTIENLKSSMSGLED